MHSFLVATMKRHTPSRLAAVTIAAVTFVCGCHSAAAVKTRSPATFDGLDVEQEMAMRRVMSGADETWKLAVAADVEALCPGSRPVESKRDPAETRGAMRFSMRRLAECYRDGAARKDDVTLVAGAGEGRRAVAFARARALADVLASFGVAEERIEIVTREQGSEPGAHPCTVEVRARSEGRAHASPLRNERCRSLRRGSARRGRRDRGSRGRGDPDPRA
jgi:type IV pilus biogenesis protein CpaD/CtpE